MDNHLLRPVYELFTSGYVVLVCGDMYVGRQGGGGRPGGLFIILYR
jgi:hypothetical protein